MTVAYEELAKATSVRTADVMEVSANPGIAVDLNNINEEVKMEFGRAYNLNPDDVIIVDFPETYVFGDDSFMLTWTIPKGKTYMSTGFTQEVGDSISAMVVGTPDNIEYEFGIKDPKQIMRYAEGKVQVPMYLK